MKMSSPLRILCVQLLYVLDLRYEYPRGGVCPPDLAIREDTRRRGPRVIEERLPLRLLDRQRGVGEALRRGHLGKHGERVKKTLFDAIWSV